MRWQVKESQSESEWFDEYVKLALATSAPSLPPKSQRIGRATAFWFETEPGIAFITAHGGSVDDRTLACLTVREQLAGHGIRRAQYTLDNRHAEGFRKTADWTDIEAKAKRLIQSGQVQILRNGYNNIVGMVQGDHGTYQTEIGRDDPQSRAVTTWQCDCPWDQYAWQRTRQWKKYEGRVCSHVLATYWASQSLPLDEDAHPSGGGPNPGMPPTQPSLFNMPAAPATPQPSPYRAPMAPEQGQQMQIPGMVPGQPVGVPAMPSGPDIIPQYPLDPSLIPQINPASVPGLRQPSPTDPIQYPGGTFSKVADWDFDWDFDGDPGNGWKYVYGDGKFGIVDSNKYHDDAAEQAGFSLADWHDGGGVTHSGTMTPDGLISTHIGEPGNPDLLKYLRGIHPNARYPVTRREEGRAHEHAWKIAAEQFTNGQMVSNKYEDWGTWVGRSEEHGAGAPARIPANSPGEVLGQDPTTGMVQVLFMNPGTGVNEHGKMEPWGATAWFLASELVARPDIKPPGPAIRRRR